MSDSKDVGRNGNARSECLAYNMKCVARIKRKDQPATHAAFLSMSAAEQIPPGYSRAEDGARELNARSE